MDLSEALPRITWRRFQVLLRALSPASATVSRLVAGQMFGQGKDKVHAVAGPKASQRAFVSLFGGGAPTG